MRPLGSRMPCALLLPPQSVVMSCVKMCLWFFIYAEYFCPLEDAIHATVKMLAWRGMSWTAFNYDWIPSLQMLVPTWVEGCAMHLQDANTAVVVTDAPRIGLPLLKTTLEALDQRGKIHALLLVSKNNVTTQNQNLSVFANRLSIAGLTVNE